ncbi:MAG: hypothetical protein JNK58_00020 [Phycisphaerae bacterium]|nr:hypothetical protein [Phycisphaerae bacterium]
MSTLESPDKTPFQPFQQEVNHVAANPRLDSAVLLAMIAVITPCRRTFADPPCSVVSVAPEGGESICLDDWIRFNQKLWVDLFWPNAFDLNHPLIFVDERLGSWINPVSTSGQNEQGDHLWIDSAVPPELVDFQVLLSEGTINVTQYQQILASLAAGAKEMSDCKATKVAAFESLDVELELFQQLQCLEACIATPPPP